MIKLQSTRLCKKKLFSAANLKSDIFCHTGIFLDKAKNAIKILRDYKIIFCLEIKQKNSFHFAILFTVVFLTSFQTLNFINCDSNIDTLDAHSHQTVITNKQPVITQTLSV